MAMASQFSTLSRPGASMALRPARTHGSAAVHRAGSGSARGATLRVQASKKDTMTEAEKKKYGFRWDPAMQRWVRDARVDMELSADSTVIKPKTGGEYTVWPIVHTELMDYGLKSWSLEETQQKMNSNKAIVVDVRVPEEFEKSHMEGAINVPMFRDVQGTGPWDIAKKVAMGFFAMRATERDPDFPKKMEAAVKGGKSASIILVCSIGGTLDTKLRIRPDKYKDGYADEERNFGRESRSLKAAYELVKAGFKNVQHMEGGVQQWRFQKFPVAGTVHD